MYVKKEKPEGYLDPRTIRSQQNYVGKIFKCLNSDLQFKIENFISYKEVLINFIGTNIRRTVTMTDIEKGILDPFTCFTSVKGTGSPNCPVCWTENCTAKDKYVGLQYRTNEGYIIEVIDYTGSSDVTVKFLINGYITHTTMQNIKKGQVHNPYKPNKFGGYEGEGPYKSDKYDDIYRRWYNMLIRADQVYYNSHRGTNSKGILNPTEAYNNLCISPQFLNYSIFAEWYLKELSQLNPNYDYDIDKDALYHKYKNYTGGRKCYGPDTCILIPHGLNVLLSDRDNGYYVPKYKISYTINKINNIKEAADKFYADKALTQKSYFAIINYLEYLKSTIV